MNNKEMIIAQDILNSFTTANCLDIDIDDIRNLILNRSVCYADSAEASGSGRIEEAVSHLERIEASGDGLKGLLIASGNITLREAQEIHGFFGGQLGENRDFASCVLDDASLGNDRIRITVILLNNV